MAGVVGLCMGPSCLSCLPCGYVGNHHLSVMRGSQHADVLILSTSLLARSSDRLGREPSSSAVPFPEVHMEKAGLHF